MFQTYISLWQAWIKASYSWDIKLGNTSFKSVYFVLYVKLKSNLIAWDFETGASLMETCCAVWKKAILQLKKIILCTWKFEK